MKRGYYWRGHIYWTVDVKALLSTACRDFLIRNNGDKVLIDDLKGKTIVLFICPIDRPKGSLLGGDILDMTQAYQELAPLGGTEFVFVPIYTHKHVEYEPVDPRTRFNELFSAIPFPAVPFSDALVCGDRVVNTFSLLHAFSMNASHWVIIDPTTTVVATRARYCFLFKHFGGAELYPLSLQRINSLVYEFDCAPGRESRYCHSSDRDDRLESRERLIHMWDQLLVSPGRDFLLSANGARVPVSSLNGKVIGLYFCENIPCPPRMQLIKETYRDARLRGYDFEIVQINYHYEILDNYYADTTDFSVQQRRENIDWLTLPFGEPSCRKLQRIFKCKYTYGNHPTGWNGDCLVIIDDSRPRDDGVLFEFCGAEIIEKYGVEGYPFTRQSLCESEYTRLKKEVKLQLLFPPGLCQFIRFSGGGGFDLVNLSQLKGKRVLVLSTSSRVIVSMLKSKYRERAKADNFELVFVKLDSHKSKFIQHMPWLVHPYSEELTERCFGRVFKSDFLERFAAFDIDGQLIYMGIIRAIPDRLECQFPFLSGDMREAIQEDLKSSCSLHAYYYDETKDDDVFD